MDKDIQKTLSSLKLIIADVDGTLTDGYKYYGPEGQSMKRFNVKDGLGCVLLRNSGIETALLTTDVSDIVLSRAKDMKIEHLTMGSRNKREDFVNLCSLLDVQTSEAAMIGDDYNDLHAFEVAGLSVAPADAHLKVKQRADIILNAKGGEGVIRELADMIFSSKGIDPELDYNW